MTTSMPYSGLDQAEELQPEDEISGDCAQLFGEKKRRLNLDQVKVLEKSFELGEKLEPERKMLLSRTLGLKPRQIAIWFQNRRARWKTKQLEKDYDSLKRQFESLKAENDALKSQNKKLQSQLMALRSRVSAGPGIINLNRDNECSWNNESTDENSCNINLNAISMDNIIYHHEDTQNAVVFAASVRSGAATLTFNSSLRPDHRFQGSAYEPFYNVFSGIEEYHDFVEI